MFITDPLGHTRRLPDVYRMERMTEVVRYASDTPCIPPRFHCRPCHSASPAVGCADQRMRPDMQHSDITVPTIRRKEDEPAELFLERHRAERHRLNMAMQQTTRDYGTGDPVTEHGLNTMDALMGAVLRGQR